ncbi:MAG: PQQ-dependent sugar dehydrogenase [Chitinophagaceae bacterium]|nr:PQQ-dependent sugar dehydrogenase [Oligoflexus sp.]
MKKRTLFKALGLVACLLNSRGAASLAVAAQASLANPIVAPNGIVVQKLPAVLAAPRLLTFAKMGDMIVGSSAGKVYRLKAPYTSATTVVDFGGQPHSVSMRNVGAAQELWIGETEGIYKAIYDPNKSYKKSDFTLVAALPGGSGHSTRTVKISPDNHVFVSLGIQDNCSPQYLDDSYSFNERRGGIFELDESTADATKLVPYASGLRNPVGFSWQPETGVMYADNNGPDHWGFELPREVFEEVHQFSFFGMPWYQVINGKVTPDTCAPQDRAPQPASKVSLPVATFNARSAPMDVAFIGAPQLVTAWSGSALVALHGSWGIPPGGGNADRRSPKIVLVEFVKGKPTGKVSDFLTGFQDRTGKRFARPVGLAFGPDNALYFTSDSEGAGVYRVTSTAAAHIIH